MAIANVALSDTFDLWRTKTNQVVKVVNDVENLTHPLANMALQAVSVSSDAANTANAVANTAGNIAFDMVTSNTILMDRITEYTNSIITTVFTDIYNDSNVAYIRANTAIDTSNLALQTANAFVANSADIISNILLNDSQTQNTLNVTASSYVDGFLANVSFSVSFQRANTATIVANTAYNKGNAAHNSANTAASIANSAFLAANTGISITSNTIFGRVNAATDIAVAAFNSSNVGITSAFNYANTRAPIQAYAKANSAANDAASASSEASVAFAKGRAAHITANSAASAASSAQSAASSAQSTASQALSAANDTTVRVQSSLDTGTSYYFTVVNGSGNSIDLRRSDSSIRMIYGTKFIGMQSYTGWFFSGVVSSPSDETLKENIKRVENALELVDQLNGVTFTWKKEGYPDSGVIAQNIKDVLPHLVAETVSEDKKTKELVVNYTGLSAYLIEAIKELNKEVKDIKRHLGLLDE